MIIANLWLLSLLNRELPDDEPTNNELPETGLPKYRSTRHRTHGFAAKEQLT
jgi:hypothetical protein